MGFRGNEYEREERPELEPSETPLVEPVEPEKVPA